MSQWERRRVSPHGDELETGMDVARSMGYVDGAPYPWDWSDERTEELHEELQQQLARKRQPGFTADWGEA